MEFGATDVGAAGGIAAGSIAEAFELALANVFKLDTVGPGGGGSIEVDGNAITTPDQKASLAGEDGALGERSSANRDKGDDVGGADAGMDAALPGEIDEFGGLACGADSGFDDAGRSAGDRDDGAVVRLIERPVQQTNAFDLHGGDDLADLGGVGTFGEIRDTLDDGFEIHS